MKRGGPSARDEQQLYSGLVRLHILHHACREPVFGLGMIEELARHGYRLSPGTLYPLLHGLEAKGLLRSRKRLEDGRIRRVYTATGPGRKVLAAAKERVRELFGELFEEEQQRNASDEDGFPGPSDTACSRSQRP